MGGYEKPNGGVLTAFASDVFDAKKTNLRILPGKTAHDPMDHMVAFFSQVLPILHPDQRDKLATEVDKPFGSGGGSRMRGMHDRGPADDIVFPFEEPVENAAGAPSGPAH